MDLNETKGENFRRHPWELSRTKCVLNSICKYIDKIHGKKAQGVTYVNIGAGDCYFDRILLKRYLSDEGYMVDIGYENAPSEERLHKYNSIEEVPLKKYEYAVMMDSLEYMEDDAAYIRTVAERLRRGGYFFFTLPAYPSLFSEHDIHVKNLRRYSRQSFRDVIEKVPELEIKEQHYFYTSLLLVRYMQKLLHIPIDPNCNVTSKWEFRKDGFVTKFLTGCLNLDFYINAVFYKIGIPLPGLSMLVICKRI